MGAGSGIVTSASGAIACGGDCTETLPIGTSVTLTALPAAGSVFTGWRGGCTGTGACTLTVTADTVITASFAPMMFTLTVALAGNGSGTVTSVPTGIACGTDCTETLASGTSVTLIATPAPGSVFVGWSGGGCFGTMRCTFTIADTVVTATFAPMMFTLSVTLAGTSGGAVTSTPAGITCGSDCTETLASGTAVTLTAVPARDGTRGRTGDRHDHPGEPGRRRGTAPDGLVLPVPRRDEGSIGPGPWSRPVASDRTGRRGDPCDERAPAAGSRARHLRRRRLRQGAPDAGR